MANTALKRDKKKNQKENLSKIRWKSVVSGNYLFTHIQESCLMFSLGMENSD